MTRRKSSKPGPKPSKPVRRAPGLGSPPRMPGYLSSSAKWAWRRYIPAIHQMGGLTKADEPMLVAFSMAAGNLREANQAIEEHGLLVTGDRGHSLKRNPATLIVKDSIAQLKVLADELLISPAARARMGLSTQARGMDTEVLLAELFPGGGK